MRRGAIWLTAVALLAALCSCTEPSPDTPQEVAGTSSPAASETQPALAGEVEVFSWWTAGAQARGLEALLGVFKEKYPQVNFVNSAVTSGGGTGQDLLAQRLENGQPPDSFQLHAGAEAADYIAAKQVTDITLLYEEFGLEEAFPAELRKLVTVDDKAYAIPTDVHRANVLWANVKLLQAAGLPADKIEFADIDSFLSVLAQIRERTPTVTPLAVGNTWCQVHLFETVLLADLGAAKYRGLFEGTADWNGPEVAAAIGHFAALLGYANTDRDLLDWEPAAQLLADGRAAFNIMGDWMPELLDSKGMVAGTDYLWAPAPGTLGAFDFVADSFPLAEGAPHPATAKAWLEVVASAAGQVALSKAKGSIPARSDIDLSEFSAYQQASAYSYSHDELVGSLQHGAMAGIAQVDAVGQAVAKFAATPMGAADQGTFQADLAAVFTAG
ncbi:MAG: ABC transporter substrate-binding protein [Propionibacteriaceae bacterium]|jgi:glucose/mannose transport system substrate-binding protein|nr:ABC transporter substrate-binding protein [Propionibacteriaceae bacterium]